MADRLELSHEMQERFRKEWNEPVDEVLKPLAEAALHLLQIRERFGRDRPDVVT